MIIVQLSGGLGNQLFQYAAAKSLSLHHQAPLFLDISSFSRTEIPKLEVPRNYELTNFPGIKDEIISNSDLRKLFPMEKKLKYLDKLIPPYKKSIYREPFYHYDKNFFRCNKNVFLIGGWQSEKYFLRFKESIRNILNINKELVGAVMPFSAELHRKESVAIHVRRGDYLRKRIIYEWHGVMEKEYYLNGLELVSKKVNIEKILFFTDDPVWVENELLNIVTGEIVTGIKTHNHIEDFYLMSQCRHNIIANSSFSWWSAWLNNNQSKIVIAPKKWFHKGPKDTQDIIPETWIKI